MLGSVFWSAVIAGAAIVGLGLIVLAVLRAVRPKDELFGASAGGRIEPGPERQTDDLEVMASDAGAADVYTGELPGADEAGKQGFVPRSGSYTNITTSQKFRFNVGGKEYEFDSIEDVPPEFREMMRKARDSAGPGRKRICLNINGKAYEFNSMSEVPDHLKKHLPPHLFGGT